MNIKPLQYPCGFCAAGGRHDLCPGAILNGNKQEILTCPCGCPESQRLRCLNCNFHEDVASEINPDTRACWEKDSCDARIERRLAADPTIQLIRSITETGHAKARQDKQERAVRKAPNGNGGKCLHCGEATKGGLFLPGHDAAHVSQASKTIATGDATLQEVLDSWVAVGISEALQAKLTKRVAA